jgi:hypothetical protein
MSGCNVTQEHTKPNATRHAFVGDLKMLTLSTNSDGRGRPMTPAREHDNGAQEKGNSRVCALSAPSARVVVVAILLEEGRPPARNSGDTVCIIDLHTSDTHRISPLFIVTSEPVDIPGWEAPPTRRNIRACSKVRTTTGRVDRGELCYERKVTAVGSN